MSTFGPWVEHLDPAERRKRFRSLASLAAAYLGSSHPLVTTLRKAEVDTMAATEALELLDTLPALTKRRMLSTFGAITSSRPKSRGRS
jgi:hypothetical protein